jgi:tRNA modification GTPase
LGDEPRAEVSAFDGRGVVELRRQLAAWVGGSGGESGRLQVSLRQAGELVRAAEAIDRAIAELAQPSAAAELAAVEARDALEAMGRVTGETADEELLDALFSRFCVGK